VFHKVTKKMSEMGQPLVHQVIPLIDYLARELEKVIADTAVLTVIQHGATNALRLLNKYYTATDDCEIYHIARIMHPCYKLHYFCKNKWEEEWVTTALEMAQEMWLTKYK
ncbi:hypothetical protein M422DRAFT_147211, partial [Sphaerobolus stellatus SS14]